MASTRRSQPKGRTTTTRKANRGTRRNPAKGVVDLRYATPPRPNARKPYYATWYDAVNKCKGGSKAFETLPDAVKWVQDQERDNLAAYHRGEPSRVKSRAFGDLAWQWHRTLSIKAHCTVNAYGSHVRMLIKHFGQETPVAAIDSDDVHAWLHDALKVKGLSNGTVKARLNVLNQIMNYAMDRKFRMDNPCRGITRPKDHQREAYIITAAELDRVLAALDERYWLPVLLAYYSGLRIGEVCGLRGRELDLANGMVKVVRVLHGDGTEQDHAKGGKRGDWADLPDSVLPEMRRLLKRYPPLSDGSVLSHKRRDGSIGTLSQSALRRLFKKACKAAGLPVDQVEIRFHDLRHTCATHYAEMDAPAYVIQAQLRHGRMDTSQRYIRKVKNEQRRKWANIVAAVPATEVPPPADGPEPAAA